MRVVVSFSADSELDRDILQWLEARTANGRSEAIRAVLRQHISGSTTLEDVLRAVRELKGALTPFPSPTAGERGEAEEPPEAAAALDELGR